MVTLVKPSGTKQQGTTYAPTGLSNSGEYSNWIKDSTATRFFDSDGLHSFHSNIEAGGDIKAYTVDKGFVLERGAGTEQWRTFVGSGGHYDITRNSGSGNVRVINAPAFEPGSDNTQNLGSPSKRWANLYVGDMQLSNQGNPNDVDQTEGSWTIQEGAEDLFIINRKSGKKYKFKLEEII
jgi:hypothetical protein